jgi:hypothetical protein
MNKYYEIAKTRTFAVVLIVTMLVAGIVYNIVYRRNASAALKNSDFVKATIVDIIPTRGSTSIHVEYLYNGVKLKSDFSVTQDSFKINEKVLLKVARKYPDEYIEFIKTIR